MYVLVVPCIENNQLTILEGGCQESTYTNMVCVSCFESPTTQGVQGLFGAFVAENRAIEISDELMELLCTLHALKSSTLLAHIAVNPTSAIIAAPEHVEFSTVPPMFRPTNAPLWESFYPLVPGIDAPSRRLACVKVATLQVTPGANYGALLRQHIEKMWEGFRAFTGECLMNDPETLQRYHVFERLYEEGVLSDVGI
jgi:hypothetical protein